MNIGARIILSFGALGLSIAIAVILAIGPIESDLGMIGSFHTAALHRIQNIEGTVKGAVEESFAYVVSGDEVEKEEFLAWARDFAQQAEAFAEVARLGHPGGEKEDALFDRLRDRQRTLVAGAVAMFDEYDTRGSISGETFAAYEQTVDALLQDIDVLVDIKWAEMTEAQGLAVDSLRRTRWFLRILGLCALLCAIAIGWWVSRWVARISGGSTAAASHAPPGEVDGQVARPAHVSGAVVMDATIVAVVTGIALILSANLDFLELLYQWSRGHEGWEIDEIIIVAIVLVFALSVFSLRRWQETRRELVLRERAEQSLWEARDELEVRVRERTDDLLGVNESLQTEIAERKRVEGQLDEQADVLQQSRRAALNIAEDLEIENDERKQTERRLEALLGDLDRSNKNLEDFAFVVSHDLRAPLRGIGSVVGWLSESYAEKLDDQGREYLGLLDDRTQRLHGLIEGILRYSRVGRTHAKPEWVDSAALINEVVNEISPPASIAVKTQDSLPSVFCDRLLLRQVLQNLIDNAIKHLGKPEGEVAVSCASAGDSWEYCVRDNGVGIEERHFGRIFKMFQSLKPRDEAASTGIGLSLVKQIVEREGGSVRVESVVGQGAAFFFTVLRHREDNSIHEAGKLHEEMTGGDEL